MLNSRPLARRLFALLLLALLALAAATVAADSPPVENYRPWSAWTARTSQFDVNRCQSMQVGDANGDHLDDLICAYNYGGAQTRTFVQFSATNHLTGWANQHPTVLTGFDLNRCRPLLSGDVDSDGRTDLICPYDYGGNETRTFVQLASGANATPWQAWTPLATGFDLNRCRAMQAGDADADGDDDLICAYDYGGDQTRTFIQFSSGVDFSGWTNQHPTVLTGFDLNRCRPLLSGDVNGDGRLDLLCPYDYGGNETRTFVQLASGANTTPWQAWTSLATGFDLSRCRNMQAGDASGDGYDDLICTYDYGGNQARTFVQRSSSTAFTGWTSQHATLQSQFNLGFCRPLVSGDVNGDGRLDLICPYDYGLSTRTFIQLSGPSVYTLWMAASTGNDQFDLDRCTTLQVGDVDGDGHTDLYCPYDYGDISTTTFVQRAAAYRAVLPAVIR
ncbi:MAG: VCBS repeat-containing protein [Anaerolineales bacterium]|nr:VCBS repeat-containing protein [Anaerolineales bacterium]